MRKIVKAGRSYLLCLFLLVAITAVAESVYAAPEVIYVPADFPEKCAVNVISDELECVIDSTKRVRPKSFCSSDLRGLDIVRGVLGLKTCAGDMPAGTGSTTFEIVLLVDDLRASEAMLKNFRPVVRIFGHGSMIVPTVNHFRDNNGRVYGSTLVVGAAMFVEGDENGKPFTEKTWRRRIKSLLDDASAEQARLSGSGGSSGKSGTYSQQRIIKIPFDDIRSVFLRRVRNKIDDWIVKNRAHNFVFDSQELHAIYSELDNAGTQSGTIVKLYVNLIRRRSDRRIMDVLFGQRAGSASGSDDDRKEGANDVGRISSASIPGYEFKESPMVIFVPIFKPFHFLTFFDNITHEVTGRIGDLEATKILLNQSSKDIIDIYFKLKGCDTWKGVGVELEVTFERRRSEKGKEYPGAVERINIRRVRPPPGVVDMRDVCYSPP